MLPKGKLKFGLVVVAFGLTLLFLIASGLKKSWIYYMTLDELTQKVQMVDGKKVKVSGVVVPGTIEKNGKEVNFLMEENGARVSVRFEGRTLPEAFGESVPVIAEGVYDSNKNLLVAYSLLTKCPSKYEAQVKTEDRK